VKPTDLEETATRAVRNGLVRSTQSCIPPYHCDQDAHQLRLMEIGGTRFALKKTSWMAMAPRIKDHSPVRLIFTLSPGGHAKLHD
jgi:hypothetical protein